MPRRNDIHTVLIIGSGPIIIGQACEFDYSGTQACKVLKEEGYRVILVNSNPATIMTDPELADVTYIEPLIPEVLTEIIKKEKVDAILPTMGGQIALNLASKLNQDGILDKLGAKLIGASQDAIDKAENRALFQKCVNELGLKTPFNVTVKSIEEAKEALFSFSFPVIIRPSYTLGGAGGGIAFNEDDFFQTVTDGLVLSPINQVLLEESVLGWKEFEFEVMRDNKDNCVIVCSIENISPMGVHTGDSITVAPALTLTDKEIQYLRDASIKIIRKIGVDTGGANVQFAVNPANGDVVVIEMNPRVSRSSALASKATGFPIAKIATKLAIGYTLDEIRNDITQTTYAAFEPALDYVVTKVPRFDFKKFPGSTGKLSTYMQSVGEAMAIGRTFPESLQKAINSLENSYCGFLNTALSLEEILEELKTPTSETIFLVAEALRKNVSVEILHQKTHIDPWFIREIKKIIDCEKVIKQNKEDFLSSKQYLIEAKSLGFSDKYLSSILNIAERDIYLKRKSLHISPIYRRIDTCAAEFESKTPYLYSTYEPNNSTLEEVCESEPSARKKIILIGSGPNRIGQGIEFDYCCVKTSLYLQSLGIETIMVNCNPETVSTDHETSNRLYFEPLTFECIAEIIEKESTKGNLLGCILQVGGQTPLKLLNQLAEKGIPILGTSPESIHCVEDRKVFRNLLQKLNIKQPKNFTVNSKIELKAVIEKANFPFILRPSYVIGGASMVVIHSAEEIEKLSFFNKGSLNDGPILVEEFLEDAVELEVDAISDGTVVFIGAIMEQFEKAGIHSGDSSCSLTPFSLSSKEIEEIESITKKLCKELNIQGFLNIQFALTQDKELYVIEANPRASRTVPFVSKATGYPLVEQAVDAMLGYSITLPTPKKGYLEQSNYKEFYVKKPIFSFSKVKGCIPTFGPEMRSTGEVMGIGSTLEEASAKAELSDPFFPLGSFQALEFIKEKGLTLFPLQNLSSSQKRESKYLGDKTL